MVRSDRLFRILVAVGAALLVVGTYLPWLRPNRGPSIAGATPMLYNPLQDAGFQAVDLPLVAVAVLAVGVSLVDVRRTIRAGVSLLAGVGIVLACLGVVLAGSSIGFDAALVPAPGWYLSVLSGLLLAVAGWIGLRAPGGAARSDS